VYVDDIVLYRNAPAPPPQGTDPGNAGIVASYRMENNVNDSVGSYSGTATGNPVYETGVNGMALVFDGVDDFVDLPIGSLISSLTDITVTGWVKWSGNGNDWQRLFDFGNSSSTGYIFMTPNGGNGAVRFAITDSTGGNESWVEGLVDLPADSWHHVAGTIDSSSMTITLYVDGTPVGSGSTEWLPQDLGETTQNWLGQSQYDDPLYEGSLDELQIYNRALSEAEVRYLAGDQ
jgi:hypothetical protein